MRTLPLNRRHGQSTFKGMSTQFNIRLAVNHDAEKLATMARDLVETGPEWSWHPERMKRALRWKDTIVPVACVGQATAGFALVRMGFEEAHMDLLAVRPGRRRHGIGRALVRWLEQSALVAGVGLVRVQVRTDRPAVQAFFRSVGYLPCPQPDDAPGSRNAIEMAHDLWCPPVMDEVR